MQQVDDVQKQIMDELVQHMQTMHQHEVLVLQQHQHVIIENGVQLHRHIQVVRHIVQLVDDVVNLLLELAVLLIVIINQVELHVVQYQEHQLVNLTEHGILHL